MRYIAADSPAAARRWVESIKSKSAKLTDAPSMGTPRFDVRPGMRMLVHGNYIILYEESKTGVEIVHVIHGARQWEELL